MLATPAATAQAIRQPYLPDESHHGTSHSSHHRKAHPPDLSHNVPTPGQPPTIEISLQATRTQTPVITPNQR